MKIKLQPDESLRVIHRQSIWVIAPRFWTWVLGTVIILLVSRKGLGSSLNLSLWVIWVVLTFWFVYKCLLWSMTSYILSTHRLMVIEQFGLFRRRVQETPIDRIMTVGFQTTGMQSVLYGYGNVEVHIIGLDKPLELKYVANPSSVKDFIWRAHKELNVEDPGKEFIKREVN